MLLILVWLIIGVGVGAAVTSFRSGAGNELSFPLGIIAGVVGAVIGAVAFAAIGRATVGEGPDFLVSLVGAGVVATVFVLIAHAIRR
ncbi:MAG: GlsB/YeaQ/YmgE family stress response membrane protein [Pyrinomonadaceae bacterium]